MSITSIKSRSNLKAGSIAALQGNPPELKGYQTLNELNNNIFTGDLTAVLGGGSTISQKYTGQPYEVSPATEVYDCEYPNLIPLTFNASKSFWECNSSTASGSIAFTLPNIAIGNTDTIAVLMKISDNTKTFNIVLQSTTLSDTITFSNISMTGFTAGTWQNVVLEMSSGTVAGTIDYTKFTKATIISNGASQVFSVYQISTANNIYCFTGALITIPIDCLTDVKEKLETKTEDIKCYLGSDGVGVTEKTFEIELESSNYNIEQLAAATGTVIKSQVMPVIRMVNGVGASQSMAVSAGSFTISNVSSLERLQIYTPDGVPLARTFTPQGLNIATYFATLTNGTATIQVDTSYNSQVLIAKEEKLEIMPVSTNKNYNTSIYFALKFARELTGGTLLPVYWVKTKITKVEKKQDKVSVPVTLTISAFGKKLGKDTIFIKEGITNA